MWGRVLGLAGAAIGAVVVAVIALFYFAGHAYRIPSSSMEPTLHCAKPRPGCEAATSDRVLALKWVGIERGDLVAFHTPALAAESCGGGGVFIKRLIGLPGETVRERDGVVFVDGRRLAEPYLSDARRDHVAAHSWRVPAGSYFLVGDNRAESCDSRVFGPVRKHDVIGRVVFRYWPLSRISFR
jgi:signal peptidase I